MIFKKLFLSLNMLAFLPVMAESVTAQINYDEQEVAAALDNLADDKNYDFLQLMCSQNRGDVKLIKMLDEKEKFLNPGVLTILGRYGFIMSFNVIPHAILVWICKPKDEANTLYWEIFIARIILTGIALSMIVRFVDQFNVQYFDLDKKLERIKKLKELLTI